MSSSLFTKKKTPPFAVLLAVSFALSSCGVPKGDNDVDSTPRSPTNPVPVGTPDPQPPIAAGGIPAESVVSPQGCLDLSKLYEKVRSLPPGSAVRKTTTDFKFVRGASGLRPRTKLMHYLAASSFSYAEGGSYEYGATLPAVTQTDCQTVLLHSGEGGQRELKILSHTATSLRLGDGDAEQTIELTSPFTMVISRSYKALDFCAQERSHGVQKSETVRWGAAEALAATNEELGGNFVRLATQALTAIPASLQPVLTADPQAAKLALSSAQMSDLMRSEISVETKKCESPAPPPEPRPEPPERPTPERPRPPGPGATPAPPTPPTPPSPPDIPQPEF